MNFSILMSQVSGGGSQYSVILMWVGIFGVMYFFMIRPQQRRAKEQVSFRTTIKAGEKVVTQGGVHVRIVSADGDPILVEAEGARMRIERAAISPEYTRAARAREAGVAPATAKA